LRYDNLWAEAKAEEKNVEQQTDFYSQLINGLENLCSTDNMSSKVASIDPDGPLGRKGRRLKNRLLSTR
jgi:hypothetical protein